MAGRPMTGWRGRAAAAVARLGALLDRALSVGIRTDEPAVARRQRFVNAAALLGGLDSMKHVVEQSLAASAALEPLIVHNLVFGACHLATPLFHRFGRNAAAVFLCAAIIIGTVRVVALTGTEGGAQFYFALAAAAFLFFGTAHLRLYVAVLAAAFAALAGIYLFLPEHGPIADAVPGYVEHLSAMVVVNVMVINVWLFTYALVKLDRAEAALVEEAARSDRLLLAILPRPIAERLKRAPGVVADRHEAVTVLFADLVGFTASAHDVPPETVVAWLDRLVQRLDALADLHKVEKIKTIGDAYMAASGLRVPAALGAERIARFAVDLRAAVEAHGGLGGGPLSVRIGIHTGPVVAGVIGGSRFAYDLWGDAVNTASRLESAGSPGRIQVSAATRAMLAGGFTTEPRGRIAAKGLGEVEAFWLEPAGPGAAIRRAS
jgi:adenylate cyclase